MAAGVSNTLWSIEDIVALLDSVIGCLGMSHYTILATVAFRVLALFVAVYGILAALKSLLFLRYTGGSAALAGAINYGFFAVLGFLLFILGKRLASLAVKGVDHE